MEEKIENIKKLFKNYISCKEDSISLINFLEYCKVNHIIDINDKRDFYNVYLDSLRKYKSKTNIHKLKKKQANFLYEIAEKLLEDFEVSAF